LGDLSIDGRIILKLILEKWVFAVTWWILGLHHNREFIHQL